MIWSDQAVITGSWVLAEHHEHDSESARFGSARGFRE